MKNFLFLFALCFCASPAMAVTPEEARDDAEYSYYAQSEKQAEAQVWIDYIIDMQGQIEFLANSCSCNIVYTDFSGWVTDLEADLAEINAVGGPVSLGHIKVNQGDAETDPATKITLYNQGKTKYNNAHGAAFVVYWDAYDKAVLVNDEYNRVQGLVNECEEEE